MKMKMNKQVLIFLMLLASVYYASAQQTRNRGFNRTHTKAAYFEGSINDRTLSSSEEERLIKEYDKHVVKAEVSVTFDAKKTRMLLRADGILESDILFEVDWTDGPRPSESDRLMLVLYNPKLGYGIIILEFNLGITIINTETFTLSLSE